MSWTYIPSSHSTGNRNVLQVDAGTVENDLSGLVGLTGVTHYVNKNHINVYEVASNIRVVIKGTLYHDPDTEILIIHHDNAGLIAGGPDTNATTAMSISGTSANPAYYYYGTTRTNSNRGTSTNSKSTGLIFTANRISNWHPADACLGGGGNNAHFVGRGGVILTGRPCTGDMVLDVIGTTWRGTTSSLEWRNPFGNELGSFDGTFDGIAVLLPAFNATFKFANSSIGEVINNGLITYHTLREFDVSQNIYDYDIGSDGMNGRSHREYEVINSATGTDVVKMWRNTRGSTGQRGVVVTKKEVSFNFKDTSGSAIEGVELYLEDNPSAYAKNATFLKSKAFDTTNGYTASGNSPITRGVVNANGDMVYDYSTPEIYNKTSDANGDVAKFEVLTGVQIHEFNTSDSDAGAVYGMHIRSNGHWALSSTNTQGARYSDWDTANFGGFYRVDRRSDSNTNADDFTFKFCSYGHSLSTSTQALKGLGELEASWVLFDDALITDPRVTTDDYTEIDTPKKFYNKAKAHLVDNYQGEEQTIVSRDGNIIDAGSYDVTIDANASAVFDLLPAQNTNNYPRIRVKSNSPKITPFGELEMYASHVSELNGTYYPQYTTAELNADLERFFLRTELDPNDSTKVRWYLIKNTALWTRIAESESSATMPIHPYDNIPWKDDQANLIYPLDVTQMQSSIAIKASTYTGDIKTTGEVVLTDVSFVGQIEDKNGIRKFGQYQVDNLIPGSRVQVYNNTKGATVFNDIVDSNTLTRAFSSGEMLEGDEIRVRVAYQDGLVAKEPQEILTTAELPTWSVRPNLVDAVQYNNFLLDGSSVSEFALDLSTGGVEVDINDDDNSTTIQRFGAWYYYQLMTSDGIKHLFGAINWLSSNQIAIDPDVVDIKLDNKKSAPLLLTGGRMYRLDDQSIIGPTSNSIQIDYSPIYIANAPLISEIEKNTKLIPALL